MAVPTGVLWRRDPHTGAKHQVLEGYLRAWFPILLQSSFESVTVFEGFAGPGEYLGGEDGSPIKAMRALLGRQRLVSIGKPVRFAFLEEVPGRVNHLRSRVSRVFGELPGHVTCEVHQGRCELEAVRLLTEVGAWGQPIFANLDPFDAYVPLSLIRLLAENVASEVFVTFMSDRLRRFASVQTLPQGDEMFGTTSWRKVAGLATPEAKEAFLIDAYRATLRAVGLPMTAAFQLLDERGGAFWLLYGTGNERGLERMKDAMWKVDPVGGYRFRDPRDPHQGELFGGADWQPDLGPLRHKVVELLRERGRIPHLEVRRHVLHETVYRAPHATKVLGQMVTEGKVGCDPRGRLRLEAEVWPISDEPMLF